MSDATLPGVDEQQRHVGDDREEAPPMRASSARCVRRPRRGSASDQPRRPQHRGDCRSRELPGIAPVPAAFSLRPLLRVFACGHVWS